MTVLYALVRLPEGETARTVDLSDFEGVPFGPLEKIKQRLLDSKAFEEVSWPPSAKLPSHVVVRHVEKGSEFRLSEDPVDAVGMHRAGPWELLAVIDVLKDLGPFGVFDFQDNTLIDPGDLEPGKWEYGHSEETEP